MPDPVLDLAAELIAIDSVNPALVPGGAGETVIASAVAERLRRWRIDVEVSEAAPGRPNVVGVLEGSRSGRTLMLCGHLDTVGVAGMEAPFHPVERDGRLYGRGAQDMKGGLAAILGAAQDLSRSGGLRAGRLIVACVADEEHASVGAEAVARRWMADAAVVAEPTDLTIATCHKGFAWVEVETGGRAAHGSRPSEGKDAILRMGRILRRLEELDRRLQAGPPHPLLGAASLHASRIEGGRELSTYPDRCLLQVERRTILGEPGNAAESEVLAIASALAAEDPDFEARVRPLFSRPAYETPAGHPILPALEAAVAATGRPPRRGAMSYWTDAAILGQSGIASVVFGPGGEGLHGLNEYVRTDEVITCRDALASLARAFCAGTVSEER